jgi:hypothetical protein
MDIFGDIFIVQFELHTELSALLLHTARLAQQILA